MVTGFMCHENAEEAVNRGLEGFQFFGYALSHFYITGTHVPGQFNIWEDFKKNAPPRKEPTGGIGNPDQVRKTLETFEQMGVDQVIFIQQAGNNRHEHICQSLELFADRILPDFKAREAIKAKEKADELAPYIEQAMARIPALPKLNNVPELESYPVLMQKMDASAETDSDEEERKMVSSIAGARK